ncbi:AMP-dependent synthetase [Afipia sp. P52-10]|uniref:phenylacetate--CoA ligase family protein n=1 Tax=Afipia sp. P52-10 TaxID=1429916 RepID=UPI0003DF01F0|nr:AMP-binding protein [Afipia sp. P52-10]ETR78194.1 AMP-dependent synthetase [Afipia sp. P52-10]
MSSSYYDDLEVRPAPMREQAIAERLPATIAAALKAPGWARQLAGVDPAAVTSREALAKLPLLRKSDLVALQKAAPPFGGFNTVAPGQAKRILMSPGPIFEFQALGEDIYGAGRAAFAAGIRAGDIAINCFSYHLTPGAYVLETGLEAVGCAVIPGGVGNTEQQVDAIAHVRPSAYAGTPDFLKVLLDHAAKTGRDVSSLRRGLVSGAALPPSLRDELRIRGVSVLQCYAIAEAGVIAYESSAREGLIVAEHLLVEIVKPGTGDPVADGEVGEVVVTSFNPFYPMIRLATGDLSAVLPGESPCGRTNMRIRGWLGRADQTTKVKGMFVHPGQVVEVGKRHPQLGRVRLVVTRANEQDQMTLHAECAMPSQALVQEVGVTLQAVTKLRGEVALVAPASLPNDGKVIADERPV